MPDDRRAGAVVAVEPARALRGDAIDEFDFTDRLEFVAPGGIIERAAFHEDSGDHIVTRLRVGLQFVKGVIRRAHQRFEEIVPRFRKGPHQRAQVPQMMMRVDNRQIGVDNRFGHVTFSRWVSLAEGMSHLSHSPKGGKRGEVSGAIRGGWQI